VAGAAVARQPRAAAAQAAAGAAVARQPRAAAAQAAALVSPETAATGANLPTVTEAKRLEILRSLDGHGATHAATE
jgi:hypothetical protein